MEAAMKLTAYLIALIVPSLLAVAQPAQAEDVEAGRTLVCDTQQQVERFVTLFDGDAEATISTINTEERSPSACGVATLVYVRGLPVGMAKRRNLTFQIVELFVVGLVTPGGLQAVEPTRFYSFVVDESTEA
jgi:hypothetical protein